MEGKNKSNPQNQDPISGKPGSHPIGAGIGTAAGATAGAALGAAAGPIGAAAGAMIGGLAGWLDGRVIAEGVDPTKEERYWRENFSSAPYYKKGHDYKDYEPAYKMGVASYQSGKRFEDVEPLLSRDWDKVKGDSKLGWSDVSPASKDAWTRIERGTSTRH